MNSNIVDGRLSINWAQSAFEWPAISYKCKLVSFVVSSGSHKTLYSRNQLLSVSQSCFICARRSCTIHLRLRAGILFNKLRGVGSPRSLGGSDEPFRWISAAGRISWASGWYPSLRSRLRLVSAFRLPPGYPPPRHKPLSHYPSSSSNTIAASASETELYSCCIGNWQILSSESSNAKIVIY